MKKTQMRFREIVAYYYKLGGSLVPIKNKIPLKGFKVKTPLTAKEVLKFKGDNTGWAWIIPEGFCVIDIESNKGGIEQTAVLKKRGLKLLTTQVIKTWSGGFHAYFRTKGHNIVKGYLKDYRGIEIKGPGTQITIPGSTHKGRVYTFINNRYISYLPKTGEGILYHEDKTRKNSTKESRTLDYYLAFLPLEDFTEYNLWLKILFASHDFSEGSDEGLGKFWEWCKQDSKYLKDFPKIAKLWGAVVNDKTNQITKKTLFFFAMKYGAKSSSDDMKLINEILETNYDFISTIENSGEYVFYRGEGGDILGKADAEVIDGKRWVPVTEGIIARIIGHIHDMSGIYKKSYTEMKIKDYLERNKISLFKKVWERVESDNPVDISDIDEMKLTHRLYFKCIKHVDKHHAKLMFPFFVKYLASGVKANLSEYDDPYRSNTQTCLCISSERQSRSKSTLARMLTPLPGMIYYPSLKTIREAEARLAISRASMCIIDDYQPHYQKELNNLNEILTQHTIMARPKYGRIEIPRTKRAYFALTTNYKKIINDYTGTRRWINMEVEDIDIEQVQSIIMKVFGEMISLVRSGYRTWFDTAEIDVLEKANGGFTGNETLDEILLNHLAVDHDLEDGMFISGVDLMQKINKHYGNGTVKEIRQLGRTLSRLFPRAESMRVYGDVGRIRTYQLVEVKPFQTHQYTIYEEKNSGVK